MIVNIVRALCSHCGLTWEQLEKGARMECPRCEYGEDHIITDKPHPLAMPSGEDQL